MEISIKIDYGQGYVVFLTPRDARYLYSQLNLMFGEEAKASDFDALAIAYPATALVKEMDSLIPQDTLVKESPETLRDPGSPHNIYNCYRYDCQTCKTLMGPC